ncbi:MAG: hypothetical protein HUJ68_01640 [Clostridia bacterium]|nr:hypothetical protein [Clostridia bacterium]
MLYKASEFESQSGLTYVICNDLVGSGRNMFEPAKILDISLAEFAWLLKKDFDANVYSYRDEDGAVERIGYSWDTKQKAIKFKNYINKIARQKNYQIEE